ncbi:type B 50S ribosomal protein L31 [Micropruina sonneratiae]|uniref:type B 50S ribosomal protein L31 n=1 Tax=Micropruina sonneratiae TaxID=2986940 RepID=UPI0022271004|nr:type B 50S ribosomal protein L31 [Micropruina sp. KQZ13P-5]MCW3157910.1 type B 50S ribosomal protein L31 [Micropruina sp. KQZ13P-5]
MSRHTHPGYRPVVFRDASAGLIFLTRSTVATDRTVEHAGGTYPLVDVEISSASHPFWTGRSRVVDTEGRVQAFERRYGSSRGRR